VFVFLDPEGRKMQVPTAWTDAAAPDPFLALSGARAHFRVEDLLRMEELIRGNRRERSPVGNGCETGRM
jgi:hypothetical protein